MRKRILSAILCFIMLFTSIPLQEVRAAEVGGETQPSTYTVTYNGNGATSGSVPATETVASGSTYTIKAPTGDFIREDDDGKVYLFSGWNAAADGSGTNYAVGSDITISADLTLYAKWTLWQSQYEVKVTANLDGVPTSITEIFPDEGIQGVYVKNEKEGATYLPLTEIEDGVYTTNVTENGTYIVYFKKTNDSYEDVHGHEIIIYNQSGDTVLQNYSVTYNLNGGTLNDSDASVQKNYHARSTVTVGNYNPVKAGYVFAGWDMQVGETTTVLKSGDLITNEIFAPIVLTAKWVELVDKTVQITIHHKTDFGTDPSDTEDRDEVIIQLLREEGGYNVPVGDPVILDGASANYTYQYDKDNDITTYSYTFKDLPKGTYHIDGVKSHYDLERTHNHDQNIIKLTYTFNPSNFDLWFNVEIPSGNIETSVFEKLLPQAVNVKISCWDRVNSKWNIITQQDGGKAPSSVAIVYNENNKKGTGSGFFPVWRYELKDDAQIPYYYRVEVTSFVMPDGSVLPASTGDHVSYVVSKSGLYTATVDVANGAVPNGSGTTLPGSYYATSQDQTGSQIGTLTVNVNVNPMTVTLDPEGGEIGDSLNNVILNNQYKYPDFNTLSNYKPTWPDGTKRFQGWYVGEVDATTLSGQYLTGNVTFNAKWEDAYTIEGAVYADIYYTLDNENIYINDSDRIEEVMVILQRLTDGVWNDVKGMPVRITYKTDNNGQKLIGQGEYELSHPYDGAQYRIHVIALNYDAKYDGADTDEKFTPDEVGENKFSAKGMYNIDVHLDFNPEDFPQLLMLDASRIHRFFRPTSAVAEIIYRDITSVENYDTISQHKASGMTFNFNENGKSEDVYDVWKYHTKGGLYEYKLNVSKLYGNVPGVFGAEGTDYSANSAPYTIEYSIPTWWDESVGAATAPLHATLIPKEYTITFDLNVNDREPVYGMSEFLTDSQGGTASLSYVHTWSYQDDLVAFPYREGYMFTGWTVANDQNTTQTQDVFINNQGYITIGAGLSRNITLEANWEKMTGTYYTVRYLLWDEKKDDSERTVLHGAKFSQATGGDEIKATQVYEEILGYEPHKVKIGSGDPEDWAKDKSLQVISESDKNTIIIYYKRSDGYVESADSNLHISKVATLEDDGTYTIKLETYTTDNPVTTQILNNTPLDIVMVLDQSGSVVQSGYLDELENSVNAFIGELKEHGRVNEVDHRVAIVGYASDETCGPSGDSLDKYADGNSSDNKWVNTGVFDSNGEFHRYPVTGFNYTLYSESVNTDGEYYTRDANGNYLLLMHHNEYYHLLTEDEAKNELLNGKTIYGQIDNTFVELRRNTSGLWLYGDNSLYSIEEFFTYHTDVWTHRNGIERREIHAYGTGNNYRPVDGHAGVYTRTAVKTENPQVNIYHDALVPVSVGANGAGNINPMFANINIGSSGGTYAQYGMKMANSILKQYKEDTGRLKVVVMFTDGQPGRSGYEATVANETIYQAYIAKNTYGAYVYTIGLYKGNQVDSSSQTAVYMNAVSSNYPNAEAVSDVYKSTSTYVQAGANVNINDGNDYYVKYYNSYYKLNYSSRNGWYYTAYYQTKKLTNTLNAYTDSNSKIANETIYVRHVGYVSTPYSGFYSTTESVENLQEYFENVFWQITTTITQEIVLHDDTIVRDVMGQGFELTKKTKITVYTQDGTYNAQTRGVDWVVNDDGSPYMKELASLTIGSMPAVNEEINTPNYVSTQTYTDTTTNKVTPYIQVYNLAKSNTTKPLELDYHPHTIDITGYKYNDYFINATHPNGKKVIVTITNVEARDDVVWGRSTKTNHEQSGVWLPADSQGKRQMLLAFEQPTTIFVERAYVLDYAKSFELKEWYFDKSETNALVGPRHMDMEKLDGMNWFNTEEPTISSQALAQDGENSNSATEYGKAQIIEGVVTYEPMTMQWDNPEEFYVFGNTERNTVRSQDANRNGNLWTKVRVIPANNVYYEDSFVTTESTGNENAVNGFKFTGDWTTVDDSDKEFTGVGSNKEQPETVEGETGKGVHGWTDDLANDSKFSDGSAHKTSTPGANVEFTFTGTGVDIYTRTNNKSGMVVATLSQTADDGTSTMIKSMAMDNLSISGDYYSIPTISFKDLTYGTYKVKLIATVATGESGLRYDYYLDGIRVYNPISATGEDNTASIRDAYGKEQNAVFKEVRDVLIEYKDFNSEMSDDTAGKAGAVFIDWLKEGQEDTTPDPDDTAGTGVPTYSVGTFKKYGPKNEVYLSSGQAIVLKVNPANTYYIGLKSLNGNAVTANVSGKDKNAVNTISINHSTDMYYEVTPVDGYLVIENGSSESTDLNTTAPTLSITKLRIANIAGVTSDGGIQPIESEEAVTVMRAFAFRMRQPESDLEEDDNAEQNPSTPSDGENNQESSTPSDDENNEESSKDDSKQESPELIEVVPAPENNVVSESVSTSTTSKKTATIAEMAVVEENEEHNRQELSDEEEKQKSESPIVSEKDEVKEAEDTKGFFGEIIEAVLRFFEAIFGWIGNLFGGNA